MSEQEAPFDEEQIEINGIRNIKTIPERFDEYVRYWLDNDESGDPGNLRRALPEIGLGIIATDYMEMIAKHEEEYWNRKTDPAGDIAAMRRASLQAAQSLREAEAKLTVTKALTEHRLIESVGGVKNVGTTLEDKARAFTVWLEGEEGDKYREDAEVVEYLRQQAEIARTDLEIALDGRRERDLVLREKAVAGVFFDDAMSVKP